MASNRELSGMLTAFLRAIETGSQLSPSSVLFQAAAALVMDAREEVREAPRTYTSQVEYRHEDGFLSSKRWTRWGTRQQALEAADRFAGTQRAIGRIVTAITVTLE